MSAAMLYASCETMPNEEQNKMLHLFNSVWKNEDYFSSVVKGALSFRLGQLDNAVQHLEEAGRRSGIGGTPFARAFLAMCQIRQGQTETAKQALDSAKSARVTLMGGFPRGLIDKDSSKQREGDIILWYHLMQYDLMIAEAEKNQIVPISR